jgi:transposase
MPYKVSTQRAHAGTEGWCACVQRLTRWCRFVRACLVRPGRSRVLQFECHRHMHMRHKHGRVCNDCNNDRQRAPPPPPPPPPQPSPLFDARADTHMPLSQVERAAIVTLHRNGDTRTQIASKLQSSLPTIHHWVAHYQEEKDVSDAPRSGRPRCTDEALDTAIAFTSRVEPFTPPRGIKRKHDLDISSRTIARRLDEAGLHARLARHVSSAGGSPSRTVIVTSLKMTGAKSSSPTSRPSLVPDITVAHSYDVPMVRH